MPTTQATKRDKNVVKVGSKDLINCTNLKPVIRLKPLQVRQSPAISTTHSPQKKKQARKLNPHHRQLKQKNSNIQGKEVNFQEQKELEQLLALLKVYPKEELNKSLEGVLQQSLRPIADTEQNNNNDSETTTTRSTNQSKLDGSGENESQDLALASEMLRKSSQWPLRRQSSTENCPHINTEANCLEQFSLTYEKERSFSGSPQHKYFSSIFAALVKDRLANAEWSMVAPGESILRVLICLRILLRDAAYQKEFYQLGAVKVLAQHLQKATESYIIHGDGPYVVDILKEMTNIFQKIASVEDQRTWLLSCEIHHSLVYLLSAPDVVVLHCALHALIRLAQSSESRAKIAELNSIEMLLRILQNYDIMSRKLAANLLLVLCVDPAAREYVKIYDGIPILLSLLRSDSARLLYYVIFCLVHLCKDDECSTDVRNMGGIPLLLSLLKSDRTFVSERSIANTGSSSAKTPSVEELEEIRHDSLLLKCACCTCITELVVSDTNAQQIVLSNGIYYLSQLILPHHLINSSASSLSSSNSSNSSSSQLTQQHTCTEKERDSIHTLQANAFRALRFLFSLERNRRMFKRLFTAELFEMFIDIGHYKRDIKCYLELVHKINGLDADILDEMKDNIESLNQNKEPSHYVADYAVLEHLGSGAFGSVYKVKKRNASHTYSAMKEINTMSSAFGKNKNERLQSCGNIMTELNVIKEQLKHPNIVKYKQTFFYGEKLYIVMDLIEGAPLLEHFNSLKEKKQKFSEERIWKIFIQIVLALRYLHKDKHIVHRDLTPNNVMLGENDKVTITDFGAAKHKSKDCSKMMSVVGTILYSCPELIQNHPYNEKVDIWALGCILYQMCTLKAPFFSSNIIALAKTIVEATYEPVPEGEYSDLIVTTIQKCITPNPEERLDIVQVAGHISGQVLMYMDIQHREQVLLQRKLEKERKRTQHYYSETHKNYNKYHKLFMVTQDRYDKLVNLQSSGGAASLKEGSSNGSLSDNVFTEAENLQYQRLTSNAALDFGFVNHHPHHQSSVSSNTHRLLHHSDQQHANSLSGDDSASSSGAGGVNSGGFSPYYLSGSWWGSDEDSTGTSSGSDSREGSAGSRRGGLRRPGSGGAAGAGAMAPRPPGIDTPKLRRQLKKQQLVEGLKYNQQLNLEIVQGQSRDSGIGSGDPSPNSGNILLQQQANNAAQWDSGGESGGKTHGRAPPISRSMSQPAVEVAKRAITVKSRPTSAKTTKLTISPDKVRQISDPIQQMLHQLHKIIYISQLPPTLCHSPKRRVIERFKRALFAPPPQSSSVNLKNELQKLLTLSREIIDLNLGGSGGESGNLLSRHISIESSSSSAAIAASKLNKNSGSSNGGNSKGTSGNTVYECMEEDEGGMTYERLHAIIEVVLRDSGYYHMGGVSASKPPHVFMHDFHDLGGLMGAGCNGGDPFGIQAPLS